MNFIFNTVVIIIVIIIIIFLFKTHDIQHSQTGNAWNQTTQNLGLSLKFYSLQKQNEKQDNAW